MFAEKRLVRDEDILDVGGSKLKDASVPKGKLIADTVRLEVAIPLGFIPTGLDTGSTGVKFESKQYLISSALLSCAKEIYFETDLQSLGTGVTVAIELYDYTAGAVRDSLTLSATTKRSRSTTNIKASLVAGNPVGVRFNVTTAASGTTGGGCSPILVVVLGIS
jgi:hypothetical protein